MAQPPLTLAPSPSRVQGDGEGTFHYPFFSTWITRDASKSFTLPA